MQKMFRAKKGQALGMSVIAGIAGAVWRFGERFLPGGDIVKMISNIVVLLTILVIWIGLFVSDVGISLLTQNAIVGFLFFLGIGYAAASLIADLIGL